MKKYSFLLLILCSINCKSPSQDALLASQRFTAYYDSFRDERDIVDSNLVITAKQLMLSYMDSLEKIFSEKFEFMPYVKFGLPDDISRGSLNWYLGAYRSKKKTIYLASAINHLIAVQLGTTDRNEAGRENAATFKKVTVHELGHMMHDMFLQRLTKKRLDFDYFDDGFQTTAIEYEVVSEGIADWIEARYSKKEYKYDPPEHFPNSVPEWHQEIWRQYGISFVGPILDIDPQKGLEYLVLHPFKIDKEFRASAKAYQIEAISALTSKSESR